MHLAEINVAKLAYPLEDPRIADFVDNLDRVNGIAERSEGFVWRFIGDTGQAIDARVFDDPDIIVNVSVWRDVEALERFVWGTLHRQFYQRRHEWFHVMRGMQFAMWRVPEGHEPSLEEAKARLEHYEQHGDTDHAFGWAHLPEAVRWRTMRCDAVAAE